MLVLINDRCSTAVLLEWAACCGESVATDAKALSHYCARECGLCSLHYVLSVESHA